jgi:serpin B
LVLGDESALREFVAGSKQFTGAVYNEVLVDNSDNILVSPFSAETIMALTQSGAVGTTGTEIRSSLFLPDSREETESVLKQILPAIHSNEYTLKTANKIYVENNFAIKDDFKKVATDVYQAQFQNIEFAESAAAADEINKWVEEQTANKIHDLVAPDELDATTRVVLINALYFEGNWTSPFQPLLTKKSSFVTTDGTTVPIDAMFQESVEYNFYESADLDAKFLELPFLGQDASMTIVLPNKMEGIAVLEKQMDAVLATPEYTKQYVQVSMPKFKIATMTDFKSILETLGVHAAFNPTVADFSGIAGVAGDILISKVTQKTYIDVSEIGVEAAAATSIVGPTNIPPPPDQVFTVDHPFVFYIKANDIILFEGRVLVPEY